MSHAIEGNNAAYGRGKPAWHRLGTVVQGTMTLKEALDKSNTGGWDVRVEPLVAMVDGVEQVIEGSNVSTRINPQTNQREPIGIVGDRYVAFQNEEALSFMEDVVDNNPKWGFDSIASLDGGRKVFASMYLDDDLTLDPDGRADTQEKYLLVATSHDGSLAISATTTHIRVECQNLLNMALGQGNVHKVKHTKHAGERMDTVRALLRQQNIYFDAFQREAQALIQTEITNKQFDEIVNLFDPKPDVDVVDGKIKNQSAITRWENRSDTYHDLYLGTGDVLFTNANITGTAWGALNSLTEYLDYHRQTRGDKSNLYRAHIDPPQAVLNAKADALSIVKEVAGV